jgi:hypothetical protein
MYSAVSWRRCGKTKRGFSMKPSGNKQLNMKPGIF